MTPDENARTHAKHWGCENPSAVGLRVLKLLDEWHGLHHFESNRMGRVNWADPFAIQVSVSYQTRIGMLSTYDFSDLTRLVFLAYDHCIRVDLQTGAPKCFKLVFHPRSIRTGPMNQRHPSLEEAVADWRKSHQSNPEFGSLADRADNVAV